MSVMAYLRELVRDPGVASVAPTSARGVRNLCRRMDQPPPAAIVEYGPATGVVTRRLLEFLPSRGRLLAIEKNQRFCRDLERGIDDPRLVVVHGDARDVRRIVSSAGLSAVDVVVSGIPFSFLRRTDRERLVRDTRRVLSPGGKFVAYQFFFQANRFLKSHLEEHFDSVRCRYEPVALPPLRIYEAVAGSNGNGNGNGRKR